MENIVVGPGQEPLRLPANDASQAGYSLLRIFLSVAFCGMLFNSEQFTICCHLFMCTVSPAGSILSMSNLINQKANVKPGLLWFPPSCSEGGPIGPFSASVVERREPLLILGNV